MGIITSTQSNPLELIADTPQANVTHTNRPVSYNNTQFTDQLKNTFNKVKKNAVVGRLLKGNPSSQSVNVLHSSQSATDNNQQQPSIAEAEPVQSTDNNQQQQYIAEEGPVQSTGSNQQQQSIAEAEPDQSTDNNQQQQSIAEAGPVEAGPEQSTDNPPPQHLSDAAIREISQYIEKQYGSIHFISFYAVVLSRLAYMNDNNFLIKYNTIMGSIIPRSLLTALDNVNSNELYQLLEDQKWMKADYKYLDFLGAVIPQNINIINGEITGQPLLSIPDKFLNIKGGRPEMVDNNVKYISIGWSNYGEIYIVADKKMPHTILVIFRGTYSAKTAGLYTKPTSLVPHRVCSGTKDETKDEDAFLYGIFKATTELIHTIVESITYLATDFLNVSENDNKKVKIFTTGHSLGGAMCTNFAYLWVNTIKQTAPYNSGSYRVLADEIICISAGAPRGMNRAAANHFCSYVITPTKQNQKILYLRITTKGDPVPASPSSGFGFMHPCSDDSEMRKVISEDCTAQLTIRPTPNVVYKNPLNCLNTKPRYYIPNLMSHMIYLDILFTGAMDPLHFLKGIGISLEVGRTAGHTVCRLIMGEYNPSNREGAQSGGLSDDSCKTSGEYSYKVVFFDVNKSRKNPDDLSDVTEEKAAEKEPPVVVGAEKETPVVGAEKETPVVGGVFNLFSRATSNKSPPKHTPVQEDIKMTQAIFRGLIDNMYILCKPERVSLEPGATKEAKKEYADNKKKYNDFTLCPLKPDPGYEILDPFTEMNNKNKYMPDLSCRNVTGGKTKTRKYKSTKIYKSIKKRKQYKLKKTSTKHKYKLHKNKTKTRYHR